MATVVMPTTPAFSTARFGIRHNNLVSTSLTAIERVVYRPNAYWFATLSLPRLTDAQAIDWDVFLTSLEGRLNTFYLGNPDRKQRGTYGGTPLVNGAGQTGKSLVLDGAAPSVPVWAAKGDYLQLEDHLYLVMADAASDGAGNVTLSVGPRLRGEPANNAPVTVIAPKGLFRSTSDDIAWETDVTSTYGFSFSVREVV